MASSLVVTPGFATANSYGTLTQATTYFSTRPNSAKWTALTDDTEKDKHLAAAALGLDQYFESMGLRRLLGGHFRQALLWPWAGAKYRQRTGEGFYVRFSADSGTTTTAVWSGFDSYRSDMFNGGSLYVADTDNYVAPCFEIKAISDFENTNYTLTTAAFTAAIPSGADCYAILPAPEWLRRAQFEQAIYLATDDTGARNEWNKGLVSTSAGREGSSKSFRDTGLTGHLSRDVVNILHAHMPRGMSLVRG